MPHLGHGLAGIGIAAATATDARGPWLRQAWFGGAVTLAYWPDLLEWCLKLAGLTLPHAALASLPVTGVSCAALVFLLRGVLRESSGVLLAAAVAALASHTLLDFIDGGIPLWWPLSPQVIGPDWIRVENEGALARTAREFFLFAPVAAAGIAVSIWRRRPGSASAWAAVGLFLVMFAAILVRHVVATALLGGALSVLALVVYRRRPRSQDLWQLVALAPVLVLAGVQLYAAEQMHLGLEYHLRGDYARALPHYERAARCRPLGAEAAQCRVAICLTRLGREAEAQAIFLSGVERCPDDFGFLDGLADLYLTARDERFRRPRAAVGLAERMVALAREPAFRQYAQRVLEQARRQAAAHR